MTTVTVGSRWKCAECDTEVIVVKAPEGEVTCCGRPLVPREG